ncbi:MAG: hypothetical protein JO272_00395 [Pseudonocardiales bacterium]|nr:hypothetical protein [Pseudonocardiales bacterium]
MAQISLPHLATVRLRQFVVADLYAIAAGVLLCLGIYLWVPASPWNAVIITSLPVLAGLTLLIVWHHNWAALRSAADAATAANRTLMGTQRLLARQAQELAASRARLAAATHAERRRIERDLQDGAQQQLVALAVNLRLARQAADHDPAQCGPLLAELAAQLQGAIDEIRRLAHGIYPPLLASGGLAQAIPAVAAKAAVPTRVTIDRIGRYSPEIETAVYFCCLEALQNIAKHAGDAATANISASHDGTLLTVTISDNGGGFNPTATAQGSGLTNMADRIAAVGGNLHIEPRCLEGTHVAITIPTSDTVLPA